MLCGILTPNMKKKDPQQNTDPNANTKVNKINFMLDLAIRNLDHQESIFSGHTNKINTLLALEGLTIALLLEKISLFPIRLVFVFTNLFFIFAGFIFLFSSICACLYALQCKGFKRKPENHYIYSDTTLKQNFLSYKEDTLADIKDGYEYNKKILEKVAEWINNSIYLYFLGLFVIVLGIIKI